MTVNNIIKLQKTIINFIDQIRARKILVPISGGQDSIFLMKLLNIIKRNKILHHTEFSYIYIDHQWRQNSKQQIKHIVNYTKTVNEKILIYQVKNITLSENECRKLRYHIITRHAIQYNYELIITGHNSTDKLETFIRNIARGSGIESLNSLNLCSQVTRNFFIIRPLINFDRKKLYWFCKRYCLPIWSDSTNYIYRMERNRIRQELLPYIQNYLQNNIENNILRLSKTYHLECDYIKQSTIKLYLRIKHPFRIAIDYSKLRKQNFVLQTKTIQLFYFHNFQTYLDNKKLIKLIHNVNKQCSRKSPQTLNKYFKVFIYKNWLCAYIKE